MDAGRAQGLDPERPAVLDRVERCREEAGPHCNGADRGALRPAELGRPVKLMLGGMTGWADEGFPFATGEAPGSVTDGGVPAAQAA